MHWRHRSVFHEKSLLGADAPTREQIRGLPLQVNFFSFKNCFKGPKRLKSDGARSRLYGGWGRTVHFHFWIVALVWAATCGRALFCNKRTDGWSWMIVSTLPMLTDIQNWSDIPHSNALIITNKRINSFRISCCCWCSLAPGMRFLFDVFLSLFKGLTPFIHAYARQRFFAILYL